MYVIPIRLPRLQLRGVVDVALGWATDIATVVWDDTTHRKGVHGAESARCDMMENRVRG